MSRDPPRELTDRERVIVQLTAAALAGLAPKLGTVIGHHDLTREQREQGLPPDEIRAAIFDITERAVCLAVDTFERLSARGEIDL